MYLQRLTKSHFLNTLFIFVSSKLHYFLQDLKKKINPKNELLANDKGEVSI